MKEIYGYKVTVYASKYKFDHCVVFPGYKEAVDHVNDYVFDGFVVLCEETRILVPNLSDDKPAVKSVDIDTDMHY